MCSFPRFPNEARCALAANNTRGVRPCQPEGSTLSRVTSAAPRSTTCPGATCTAATTPAPGARSSFSIFIASTTTSPAPASTRPPATSTSSVWEPIRTRSEEHTSELQSQSNLVCRLLLEKKNVRPAAPGFLTAVPYSETHRRRSHIGADQPCAASLPATSVHLLFRRSTRGHCAPLTLLHS